YKKHVKEFFDLTDEERTRLMNHVCFTAKALQKVFSPDKMNYDLFGNKVPQLHWHIIPRFKTDAAWPEPVWSRPHSPERKSVEHIQQIVSEIQKYL
ncbi:MAG: HIT family protein, partial [Nitrospiria bacterium]